MRWRGRRQSTNIEDDRMRGGAFGGVRIPFGMSGRRLGGRSALGGFGLVAFIVIALLLGVDPDQLLTSDAPPSSIGPTSHSVPGPTRPDALREFVAVVLADTEDVWRGVFQDSLGRPYREPKLVLFSGSVRSACGFAGSSVGPFYCPGDQKVYLDLDFFQELHKRFHAPGDFAQAYVIAHEVGHHIQTLLGISQKVRQAQAHASKAQANTLSVRLELQADCFAGVWANRAERTKQVLEQGDIEEALRAASAIGDDTLQRQTRGYVVPDSFTHGSSAQRQDWFQRGFKTGRLDSCDTFGAASL
jgi:uncharacterized protein